MAQIEVRHGSTAEWTFKNPILQPGEPGYDTDLHFLKIGDGVKRWLELDYAVSGAGNGNLIGLTEGGAVSPLILTIQ